MAQVIDVVFLNQLAVSTLVEDVELLKLAREVEFLVHHIGSNHVFRPEHLTQLACQGHTDLTLATGNQDLGLHPG